MFFLDALDVLFIAPLRLLFDIVFTLALIIYQSPGVSIIILSLVVNFLVLPLYKRADALQAEERRREEELRPWVDHICKTFHGDEQFMMLQTYYRQNGYSPLSSLKSACPLLLQIPFFIAAYQYLSGLELLQGIPFGQIRDLGAPDALLTVAGVSINILPIGMTIINLISGEVYMKGAPLKHRLQLYIMSLVFLFLLYSAPAGLSFYWLLNNAFSLAKNMIEASSGSKPVPSNSQNRKLLLCRLISVLGVLFPMAVCFVHIPVWLGLGEAIFLALVLQIPLLAFYWEKRQGLSRLSFFRESPKPMDFFVCVTFLSILTGLFLPSTIIADSPFEFMEMDASYHPLWYVFHTFLWAVGIFAVWPWIYYLLGSNPAKKNLEAIAWILSGIFILDTMFFGSDLGTISSFLKYDVTPEFSSYQQIINVLVLAIGVAAFWILIRKREKFSRMLCLAGILSLVTMSCGHLWEIYDTIEANISVLMSDRAREDKLALAFSRNGKNVVVFMLDRAISSYIPCIFYEKPELKEKFSGFTYYPNTVSHGAHTNFGIPGVFGGYEYTPEKMNERSSETLKDKHNEAMKVLPALFSGNGYQVAVCDIPYAGDYRWQADLSIYDSIPNVHAYRTSGRFHETDVNENIDIRNRNFICFSICKGLPLFLQPVLYNDGKYDRADAYSLLQGFLDEFTVLFSLSSVTEITDSHENNFMMLVNSTPHEPVLLQEPEYIPKKSVDNTEYDAMNEDRFSAGMNRLDMETINQMMHYHANMAAMLQIGNWLDHLRALGVYDNTRIILVADHGFGLRQMKDLILPDGEDIMFYNPLLMVKDFNSTSEFQTDTSFMTNADVPTLAVHGIINDPINPFTHRRITNNEKYDHEQKILISHEFDVDKNRGTKFKDGNWYSVHDNIFDLENWKLLEIF